VPSAAKTNWEEAAAAVGAAFGTVDFIWTREDGRLKPLSPRSLLPASSSHGPRTTSDIVAALRALNSARLVGGFPLLSRFRDAASCKYDASRSVARPRQRQRGVTKESAWARIVDMSGSRFRGSLLHAGLRPAPTARMARERLDLRKRLPMDRERRAAKPLMNSQDRCNVGGAARMSTSFEDRAKGPRGARFRVVARRSGTVVKGRRRKRSRDGTVHSAADPGSAASRVRPRRMPSEPPVHLLIGASVFRSSSLFLLRPSTRPRPSRVRAPIPAPRGLFTRALDVLDLLPPPRPASSPTAAS